jgi:hypothetical protein
MLHSVLSKVPQSLDLDQLISRAVTVQERHPPESLRSWRTISRYSVLKTAPHATQAAAQTPADGSDYFAKYVAQMRAQEWQQNMLVRVAQYRRPAARLSLTVFVVFIAWRMRNYVW